ncbi:MAG: ATP-binding protein, partial [Anaerolineae bacterium]|nr:ATP-binding protein [Anaerolineae bacterium]
MFGELKYTSARATPELVGRKEILAQIEQAIRDVRHSYLIDIQGSGGIGKTRVVNHTLEKLAPALDPALRVAKYPVDLYHTRNHSREGLLENLYDALEGTPQEFSNYHAARERLQRISDLAELNKQRDVMVNAFLEDLNRIAQQRQLVFALDTTERLFFESDPIQQRLGLEKEKIAILIWLLRDFLPRIENAVILLSGRAERGSLRPDLQKIEGKKFLQIDLKGLTEDEALEYFDAVIRACEKPSESQDPDPEAAASIRHLSNDQRRVIFYSLCDNTQGTLTIRPIWLALAIDYWVVSFKRLLQEQPLPEWTLPIQDARNQA